MNDPESLQFIAKLANSSTGRSLVKYLQKVETHYADIRNIPADKRDARIDALEMLRDSLLNKLLVLSGEVEPPNGDEFR